MDYRLNHSRNLAARGDDILEGGEVQPPSTGRDDTRQRAHARAEQRARVKLPKQPKMSAAAKRQQREQIAWAEQQARKDWTNGNVAKNAVDFRARYSPGPNDGLKKLMWNAYREIAYGRSRRARVVYGGLPTLGKRR